MEDTKSLVIINQVQSIETEKLMTIFKSKDGLKPVLDDITSIVDNFEPDISTPAGRAEIKSLAAQVAKSKVYLDEKGKDLVSGQKLEIKKVDNNRKEVRDYLDELKIRARKPLTDFENKEKERILAHELNITKIKSFLEVPESISIEELDSKLENLSSAIVDEQFQEFFDRATMAKKKSINYLTDMMERKVTAFKEKIELDKLREEKEKREKEENETKIKLEAETRGRREAEEKAERAKQVIEKEKQEAIDKSERLESEKIEREQQRIKREKQIEEQREQDRIDAEKKQREAIENDRKQREQAEKERKEREEKEEQKRVSDENHKQRISNESLESLALLFRNKKSINSSELLARTILSAIKNGEVKNITINF